jgi:hypothetical protein
MRLRAAPWPEPLKGNGFDVNDIAFTDRAATLLCDQHGDVEI